MKGILLLCTGLAALVCYALYVRSLAYFLREQTGCAKREERIFSFLFFLVIVVLDGVSRRWYIPFFLTAFLRHILFVTLVMLTGREGREKKFFSAVFLTAVNVLAGNFASSLLSCAVLVLKNLFRTGEKAYISLTGSCWIGVLSYAAVIFLVRYLAGKVSSLFHNKVKKWYLLLAIPLLFIVMVTDIVNYGASIGIMVVSNANGPGYWNDYHNELYSHIAVCILTAVSACAAGFYVFGMNRIYEEQRKKEQYRSQVAFYQMLQEQYERMERLRHDMKNHITGLQGLWKNREWEKMGSYLDQMLQEGELGSGEEASGSRTVDALLYRKHRQAQKEGIAWESGVQIPEKCPVDEYDLCVLFGNILDNALEACGRMEEKERRFVSIQSEVIKKCFLLEVRNSTGESGEGRPERPGGKENSREHGIGLLNIRDTVEKHNGVVETGIEDGVFTISILLPLTSENGPFVPQR